MSCQSSSQWPTTAQKLPEFSFKPPYDMQASICIFSFQLWKSVFFQAAKKCIHGGVATSLSLVLTSSTLWVAISFSLRALALASSASLFQASHASLACFQVSCHWAKCDFVCRSSSLRAATSDLSTGEPVAAWYCKVRGETVGEVEE